MPSHCHGQHTYLGRFWLFESSRFSNSSSWWVSSSTLSLSLDDLKSANLRDFSAASLAAMAAAAVSSLNFSFFSDSNMDCFDSSSSCLSAANCRFANKNMTKNIQWQHTTVEVKQKWSQLKISTCCSYRNEFLRDTIILERKGRIRQRMHKKLFQQRNSWKQGISTYKPFLHFQLKNLGLLGLRKCSSLRNQEKKVNDMVIKPLQSSIFFCCPRSSKYNPLSHLREADYMNHTTSFQQG